MIARCSSTLVALALIPALTACGPRGTQGQEQRQASAGASPGLPPLPADHDPSRIHPPKTGPDEPALPEDGDEAKTPPEKDSPIDDDLHIPLPESLLADGVPAIPQTIAKDIGAYDEARSASILGWHPSETALLLSTRFADTAQVHEVRAPGGARHQLTFFDERVLGATFPPKTEGPFIVLAKDNGGDEFAQNWRLDRETSELTLLTDGTSKNSLGVWSPDGQQMVYTSTRRTDQDNDFYIIDPREPASDRLFATLEGGGWWPVDWSLDGQTILALDYRSVNESALWTFDVASGERTRLTPDAGDTRVYWGGGAFSADGRSVLSVSDTGSEFRHLVRIDLGSREVSTIIPPLEHDLSRYALSEDRRTMAVVVNDNGFSRLQLHELPSGREQPMKAVMPKGVIRNLHWHPEGRLLAFTLSSARSPSDAYVLDTASQTIERWTQSEVGGLDPSTFSEPEPISWTSFDGRAIPGLYYRPPPRFAGPRPLMILIHGGPEGQARAGFITRLNYYLNELGIAIIYPNVRGSTGYGKSYTLLDNGERREDSVKDIGALLDWVGEQPDLDADRVMIMGGSYGGYMTLASAVHYADRIRCAVDIVGISNFVSFLENTKPYRRDLRRAEYGDERDPQMRAHLESISPLGQAAKITKPLFVIQGRNDPRVPVTEAEQIVETMKTTGTPVWYLEAKDEGHGFRKKRNQDYQMYATVLFVRTYLLGDPEGG